MKCNQCPRKCHTERTEERFGFCGVGELPKIARAALHFDEEPPISGTSEEHQGVVITPYQLSEEYRKLEAMGAQNIEFVTPSHYVNAILESLTYYQPRLPLIWNSSGYDSLDTIKRLEGVIDIYLPDFKYSDNALAKRLSHCGDYVETATAAIDEMLSQQPEIIIENGVIQHGVIIRHLVLPSHTKNSIGVLEIIKERYGTSALVSLMAQYMPAGKAADYPDINRKLTKREYNKILNKYIELDLDGFAQELDASDQKYVPEWNYGN